MRTQLRTPVHYKLDANVRNQAIVGGGCCRPRSARVICVPAPVKLRSAEEAMAAGPLGAGQRGLR